MLKTRLFLGAALALACGVSAEAAQLKVMISGGFTAAYEILTPQYEKASGDKVQMIEGPSMGETPQAIPNRLARGEDADVVIMVGSALDDLAAGGLVLPASKRALASGRIAAAVKAGAKKPDIRTPEALKQTLLAAKSVAYSDSASGVYVQTELFKKMGIAEQMAGKSHMIPATPVGEIVAADKAELGFQQLSELKPVKGIDIVGLIPESLQKVTVFSGGVVAKSQHPKEAAALVAYLSSPQAAATITATGMEPAKRP